MTLGLFRALPALLLVLLLVGVAGAQSRSGGGGRRQLSDHERRIREIIQQRREEALAREREQAGAERRDLIEAQQRAIASGEEVPRSAAELVEDSKVSEDTLRILGNVVMGFRFLDQTGVASHNIIAEKGTTFVSELILYNNSLTPVDRVRLALDYDKRFIKPLKVFDVELRPHVDGTPVFRRDDRNSRLVYDAKLSKSPEGREVVLLRILWEAVRPTPFTPIDFAFALTDSEEFDHTAIYFRESNILGYPEDEQDGVLSGGVMIDEEGGEPKILQGKAEELRELYLGAGAAQERVGLRLVAPEEAPRVGERMVVKVALENPTGALVDSLSFFVTYDPKVLQVHDTDKFNFIERGVNVLDGPYHKDFPWDMHRRNEVRNDRGLIHYAMSLSDGASLPSDTFAEIHFRAIAPTASTTVGFVRGRPGAPDLTSIRYFGFDMLDLEGPYSRPGLTFPIFNAPEVVEETEQPAPAVIAADQPTVRKLDIRRD